MRLDPARVRFVSTGLQLGLASGAVRFVGRENNVQLLETAFVVEGNVLKVGMLGLERLFRAALAEWTTITVPYSRITRARRVRWPLPRLIGLLFVLVAVGCVFGFAEAGPGAGEPFIGFFLIFGLLGTFLVARVRSRYVVRFRAKDGRRRAVAFRITSRPLAREFDAKMQQYLTAAARFADRGAGGRP